MAKDNNLKTDKLEYQIDYSRLLGFNQLASVSEASVTANTADEMGKLLSKVGELTKPS